MSTSHAVGVFSIGRPVRTKRGYLVNAKEIVRMLSEDAPKGWVSMHITSSDGSDVPGFDSNTPILDETDLTRIEKALGKLGRKFYRADQTLRKTELSYNDPANFEDWFFKSSIRALSKLVPNAQQWLAFWWVDPSQARTDSAATTRQSIEDMLSNILQNGYRPNYQQIEKAWGIPREKLYRLTTKARRKLNIQKTQPRTKEGVARELLSRGLSYQDVELELEREGLSVQRRNLRRIKAQLRKKGIVQGGVECR